MVKYLFSLMLVCLLNEANSQHQLCKAEVAFSTKFIHGKETTALGVLLKSKPDSLSIELNSISLIQLKKAEQILLEGIRKSQKQDGDNSRLGEIKINELKDYYRQYSWENNSLLYINFFCGAGHYDEKFAKRIIQVWDGGECFFQVFVDLKTNKVTSFYINVGS